MKKRKSARDRRRRLYCGRCHEDNRRFDGGRRRSQTSSYLLSGGLFKCGRCGSNMIGHGTSHGRYYVCGTQPYRRRMGCGAGVYVPQEKIEAEVVRGLEGMMSACLDPKGFTRRVRRLIRRARCAVRRAMRRAVRRLKDRRGSLP